MGYTPSGNILTKDLSVTGMRNGVTFVKDYSNDYYYSSAKPHAIDHIYESNDNVEYAYEYDNNGNMLMQQRPDVTEAGRRMCWDEENRIRAIKDNRALSGYVYNAGGERVWKFTGYNEQMMQNGDVLVDMVNLENKTLYASPYMVVDDAHYTKHYYSGSQRIASKIGSGFADAPVNPIEPVEVDEFLADDAQALSAALWNYLMESFTCAGLELGDLEYEPILNSIHDLANETGNEPGRFYYHSDHLGSSAFISNASGELEQHLQYLPFGEDFIEQHIDWQTRYTFSGKEKDRMTDFSYFGARYYDSEVSVWLSVDPISDIYPSTSPYAYVENNPIMFVDPNGMFKDWYKNKYGDVVHRDGHAESITIDGEKYKNIGSTYTHKQDGYNYHYVQDEVIDITAIDTESSNEKLQAGGEREYGSNPHENLKMNKAKHTYGSSDWGDAEFWMWGRFYRWLFGPIFERNNNSHDTNTKPDVSNEEPTIPVFVDGDKYIVNHIYNYSGELERIDTVDNPGYYKKVSMPTSLRIEYEKKYQGTDTVLIKKGKPEPLKK